LSRWRPEAGVRMLRSVLAPKRKEGGDLMGVGDRGRGDRAVMARAGEGA
jgi:hypothetical protein